MKECNCLPLPEPPSETCLVHSSPQSQAEAMAREVFKDALRIFGGENISEDAAFVKAISTALSKLIAENERLKKEHDDYKTLTRGNFNCIWNRLQVVQLAHHMKNQKQAEREVVEIKEIADYCVHHGSTLKHAKFDTLKTEIEDIKSLRSQLTATEAKLREYEKYVPYVVRYPLTAEKKDTCANCGKHKYDHAGGGYCPNTSKKLGDTQDHYDYSRTFKEEAK